jgi:hypothetical protein
MAYVADNHRRHALRWGARLPPRWVDPCSSESAALGFVLPEPTTWLLRMGWRLGKT